MEGNEFFRVKNFDGALMAFNDAIKTLEKMKDPVNKTKVNELLSTCYNNSAACYEALVLKIVFKFKKKIFFKNKYEDCVRHCSEAIKINPNYYKAINRRARSNSKIGNYKESLRGKFSNILKIISFRLY